VIHPNYAAPFGTLKWDRACLIQEDLMEQREGSVESVLCPIYHQNRQNPELEILRECARSFPDPNECRGVWWWGG